MGAIKMRHGRYWGLGCKLLMMGGMVGGGAML
jgi:hypothetical protein